MPGLKRPVYRPGLQPGHPASFPSLPDRPLIHFGTMQAIKAQKTGPELKPVAASAPNLYQEYPCKAELPFS
jgi:hypothetical protein